MPESTIDSSYKLNTPAICNRRRVVKLWDLTHHWLLTDLLRKNT